MCDRGMYVGGWWWRRRCVCRKKYKGVSFEVTAATGKPASPPSPTHSLGYHAIAQSLFEVRLGDWESSSGDLSHRGPRAVGV